jgi:arylsulfatase A-like enzyme
VKPNILLVVFDTARVDAFEPYGAPAGRSPVIADLARRGSAAPYTMSTAGWTVPAHVSMFSGVMPRSVGLGQAHEGGRQCRPVMEDLNEQGRILPEVLRRNGYETQGISANLWIDAHTGFDIGFDSFQRLDTRRIKADFWEGRRSYVRWMVEALRARLDDGAMAAERVMEDWIGRRSEKPFFWFINLLECHSPYMPPRPYNSMGPLARMRAAHDVRTYQGLEPTFKACLKHSVIDPDILARLRTLYTDSILQVDAWMGRILDMLERNRLLDDTLVIATSDHGENLGEGRLLGHAFSIDQRLVHVPLVTAGPGAFDRPGMTSLRDMPRLVADAAGITGTAWHDQDLTTDVALAEWENMLEPGDPRGPELLENWDLPEDALRRLTVPMTAAIDGRYKLLLDGDREALYDLSVDPLEAAPIADPAARGIPAEVVERLRAAVRSTHVGHASMPEPAAETSDEEAELERQMRVLGYM